MNGIGQSDLEFFWECFEKYWDYHFFLPILFVLCIVFMVFRKNKIWNEGIIYPLLLGCATVFNPFFMRPIINKFGFANKYYRFYWIVPFAVVIAAVLIIGIDRIKKGTIKVVIITLFCMVMILCGNRVVFHAENWNIYKIEQDVIDISRIIHADTAKQMPIVFIDITLYAHIRQYDPSIIIILNTSPTEYYALSYELEEIRDICIRQEKYLALIANYNYELDPDLVNYGLVKENVDYFVRNKTWYSQEYINDLNVEKVGETEGYEVYRIVR